MNYDSGEAPAVIELMAKGQIDLSKLIRSKVAYKDVVGKGFKKLVGNPEKHLKISLTP